MTGKVLISVIIPAYRDWERLALCLECLARQTIPAENFEIVIVNNDPADFPPENYSLPGNARIVSESKPGSYAARNCGLSVAQGQLYAFTDSDCQPDPRWLEAGLRCFETDRDISRVGGKISLLYSSGDKLTPTEIYEKAFAFRQQEYVEEQGMAATANMFTKKEVLEAVGNFDESLMSGGDAEWGMRAERSGFRIIYSTEAIVRHPTRKTFSDVSQKAKREIGGRFMLDHNTSFGRKLCGALLGFLPPIRSINKALVNDDLNSFEKFVAITMRYYLRVVVHLEKLKLLLHLKRVERV